MKLIGITACNLGPFLGEHDLDLSSMDALFATGDNGRGKSMLFVDIPTWVTWGKARVPADNLISLGASEGWGRVLWDLAGTVYRIERHRSLAGRGKSTLDIDRRTPDGWENLSGSTIPDTQARIIQALGGLTYELYVLTGCSVQGKSDNFMAAGPTERMGAFGTMLGLERFRIGAPYRKTVRGWADKAQARIEAATATFDRLAPVAETLAASQETLERATGALRGATEAKVAAEQAVERGVVADTALRAEHAAIADVRARIAGFHAQHKTATERAARLDVEATGFETEAAATPAQDVEALAAAAVVAEEKARQAQAAAEAAGTRYWEAHGAQAQASSDLLHLKATIEKADRDAAWKHREAAVEAHDLAGRIQVKIESNTESQAAVRRAAQGLDAVPCQHLASLGGAAAAAVAAECGACPLIKSAVEARDMLPGLVARADALRTEYEAAKAEAARLLALPVPTPDTDEYRAAKADVDRLTNTIEEGKPALLDLHGTMEATRRAATAATDDAAAARRALGTAQSSAGARTRLLDQAKDRRAEATRALEEAATAQSGADALALTPGLSRDTVGEAATSLLRLQEDRKVLGEAFAEVTRLSGIKATAQAAVDAATQAQAERVAQQDIINAARTRYQDCVDLDTAYRDAPQLVIETVLPEIEEAANRLLSRVSSTGMQLSLVTQAATKDGKINETLDLVVRDNVGERPYESFSGGEAFRINWSLRVALSHTLAARANVPLGTLIIDEGFGALDAEGIAAFAQVLPVTKELFDLIVVISPIPELAESFPARLVLAKGPQGSDWTLEA